VPRVSAAIAHTCGRLHNPAESILKVILGASEGSLQNYREKVLSLNPHNGGDGLVQHFSLDN